MELFVLISSFLIVLIPLLLGWLVIGAVPLAMMVFAGLYVVAFSNRNSLIGNSLFGDDDQLREQKDVVLVVDDEYQSVIPLLKLLEQAKIPFRYVADGLEAIRELKRGHFRIVFMDITMPHITGFEALERADRLIEEPKRAPTPVIVYSGTEVDNKASHSLKHLSIIDTWNKSMNLFRLHTRLNNLLTSTGI